MAKYLKNSDIKANHWYMNDKGEILLYLGMAVQDNGLWQYPKCHIYLKKHILENHFRKDANSIPVNIALVKMEELGVRHYCFTQKPKKFLEEVGCHPDIPLVGAIGSFKFI